MANQYYARQVTFLAGSKVRAADLEAELDAILAGFETVPAKSSGTFTPTATFETVGDLSVVYAEQTGTYYRLDDFVSFAVDIRFTPTFTTSADNLRIAGLPVQSDASGNTTLHAAQLFSPSNAGPNSDAWPTGVTTLFGFLAPGLTYLQLFGNGSTGYNSAFEADDFTSGDEYFIRITGSYTTDA